MLSLEGSVRLDRALGYKQAATVASDAMSGAAYLYQLSRPTATLRRLYAEEPRWAHDALRFPAQLTALLTATARGVVSAR